MYFALGAAAAGAVDLLSSLLSAKSVSGKPASGTTQKSTTPFDVASTTINSSSSVQSAGNGSQSGALSPQTLSALLAAQDPSQSSSASDGASAMKNLFGLLDGNSDGQISKSEFESQLGAGGANVANADIVFAKLDTNGDGAVSLDELSSALKGKGGGYGHHHAYGADSASSSYNLVEQMVQKRTDALALSAKQSLSVSV